uniref:Uncharacterized protein n=1 Tax=Chenopodium quinoa TaxID=63459 RepID=A0A803N5W4_CHEQI
MKAAQAEATPASAEAEVVVICCYNGVRIKDRGVQGQKVGPWNLVDQMGTHSASPSRNGGGSSRPISRSTVGKRSPSCTEKNDKKVSSSGAIRKVKSDDSLAPHTSNGNHHVELAHVDHEHGGGGAASMTRSPVADTEKGGNEVVEWPRIYLSLSRKEKEDDFYAMKGTKLPHRPKKRAKAVDRALQPKRRGLKGLETMESESE